MASTRTLRETTFDKLVRQAEPVRKARDAYFAALQTFLRNLKHAGMKDDIQDWILSADFADLLPPTVLSDLSRQQLQPVRRK